MSVQTKSLLTYEILVSMEKKQDSRHKIQEDSDPGLNFETNE
jgi:hypothetical protein